MKNSIEEEEEKQYKNTKQQQKTIQQNIWNCSVAVRTYDACVA